MDGSIKEVAELTFFGQPVRSCRPTRGRPSALPGEPFGIRMSLHSRLWLLKPAQNIALASASAGAFSAATKRPSTSIASLSAAARAAAAVSAGLSAESSAAAAVAACSRLKLAARVPTTRVASSGAQLSIWSRA
jgi:hypothetical protein